MKNYQYILLDWDGNLAKTLDVWLVAWRQTLNEFGYFPPDDEITANFSHGKDYVEKLGLGKPDDVFSFLHSIIKTKLENVELYPDALEVLEYLKSKDKKTALITTSRREYFDKLLNKYNLRTLFDVVLCYEDTAEHKPKPEPLNKALELMGGDTSSAVMIGDSTADIIASSSADIDSILFHSPEHNKFYDIDKLKQHNPTYIVEDFREIMQIIT